jgi:hypothetical protein
MKLKLTGIHAVTGVKSFANSLLFGTLQVQCGVRGSLGPPCNAVGFVDRVLLDENHLYKNPVYKRTKVPCYF